MLNLVGKEPIFQQIHNQIIKLVELNVLSVNDKLPSCRKLALDLGINPNTVQKAYSLLEEDGYIYTISKKGAFIADNKSDNKIVVLDSLSKELDLCVLKNITKEEVISLVEQKYKEEIADVKCK
jgi:GntR family transcriptional regulator